MTMAIVASTEPGNVWTTDEFAALVRDNVAKLLDIGPDDLIKADDAELRDAVLRVCSEINSEVMPAGNA
jgi:hypothetical protein